MTYQLKNYRFEAVMLPHGAVHLRRSDKPDTTLCGSDKPQQVYDGKPHTAWPVDCKRCRQIADRHARKHGWGRGKR